MSNHVYDPSPVQLVSIADLARRLTEWQNDDSLKPGDWKYGDGAWIDIPDIPVTTDAGEPLGWLTWNDLHYVYTQKKEN